MSNPNKVTYHKGVRYVQAPGGKKHVSTSKSHPFKTPGKQISQSKLKKYLSNPALRSKIPTAQLPTKYRQQRIHNAAPVTPGSSLTYGALRKAADASVNTQYGDAEQSLNTNLRETQQTGRDVAGWYDAYQKDLQAHQNFIKGLNAGQAAASQQLVGAVGSQPVTVNGASGENAQVAANASAVRQALAAANGAYANTVGNNNLAFADNQTHVVAPAQKLTALNQNVASVQKVRDQITALKKQMGSARTVYEQQQIANEIKNIISAQALGVTAQNNAFSQSIAAGKLANDTAKTNATVGKTKADIAFFNKHGYYPGTGKKSSKSGSGSGSGSKPKPQHTRIQTDKVGSYLTGSAIPQAQRTYNALIAKGYSPSVAALHAKQIIMGHSQDGIKAKNPISSSTFADIAMDVARYGGVSARNISWLHRNYGADFLGRYRIPVGRKNKAGKAIHG